MLIAFLILVGGIAAFCFLCGIALGRAGREALRLELADLKGKHETLSESYQHLRELAGQAFELAKQRHFPQKAISTEQQEQLESQFNFEQVKPDYIAPEAKNCPKCFVSVRAEEWPQNCPACGYLFGDALDANILDC